MKVYITADFINDLRGSYEANFFRLVLKHTLYEDGTFMSDADDHQYKGIKDAWIRHVTGGKTAYRVIYIRKDDSVYLYRAGPHSVEDRLRQPSDLGASIPIGKGKIEETFQPEFVDLGDYLKTLEPAYLNRIIEKMTHIGHHEIVIVSPFIETDLLARRHRFGRFLDKAVEENTIVQLVTVPPSDLVLDAYRDLDLRGICVFFQQKLHTKLYLFDINMETLAEWDRGWRRTALLGSSNFTRVGLGLDTESPNHELCYRLPGDRFDEAKDYADRLIRRSDDFKKLELRTRRRQQ